MDPSDKVDNGHFHGFSNKECCCELPALRAALLAAQAENTRLQEELLAEVADEACVVSDHWNLVDERDVVQAENQRLTAENARLRNFCKVMTEYRDEALWKLGDVERERDRLARQLTAYREALGLARSMVLAGEQMTPAAEAVIDRALLGAFTTTEETQQ